MVGCEQRSPPARQAVQSQLEGRIAAQAVGIIGILVASRDHQHTEAQNVGHLVADPLRQARIVDAGGQALGNAEPLFGLAQDQHAGIGGELPAVEAGDDGFAGDR